MRVPNRITNTAMPTATQKAVSARIVVAAVALASVSPPSLAITWPVSTLKEVATAFSCRAK